MSDRSGSAEPRRIGELFFSAMPSLLASATCFGVAFAVFTYFVGVEAKTPKVWVFIAASIPLAFVVMLLHVIVNSISDGALAFAQNPRELPRVIRSVVSPNQSHLLLLVEQSDLLGQGLAVSVYVIQDQFEILLGEGNVQIVQRDRKAQIAVTNKSHGYEQIWKDVTDNKPDTLQRTLVRPGHQVKGIDQ